MEENCKTCANSIFCDTWGEYKCTVLETNIYWPEEGICDKYKESKEEKPQCRCEDCLNREKEEN